jgi:hypothetical protein
MERFRRSAYAFRIQRLWALAQRHTIGEHPSAFIGSTAFRNKYANLVRNQMTNGIRAA